jgi:hypothetical protein
LVDHLDYTGGTVFYVKTASDLQAGIGEMKRSILAGLPVFLDGETLKREGDGLPPVYKPTVPRSYHAMIVSGYQGSASAGQFFINFGWGPNYSGWYSETILNEIPKEPGPSPSATAYRVDAIWAYYQPYNYVYVDVDSSVLIKTGVARRPYRDIPAASSMTMHGSLWIKADKEKVYPLSQYPWHFQNVTIRAYQGSDSEHLGKVDSVGETITANIAGRLKIAPAVSKTLGTKPTSYSGVFISPPGNTDLAEERISPNRITIRSTGGVTRRLTVASAK